MKQNIAKAGDAEKLIQELDNNSIDAIITRLPRPRRNNEVGKDHPLQEDNYPHFISSILFQSWFKLKEDGNVLLQVQENLSPVETASVIDRVREQIRMRGWFENRKFIWANDANMLLQNNGAWRKYEEILWFKKNKESTAHELSKLPKLYENLVGTFTKPDDTILDPFCVMGEVVLAAHGMGRYFVGFDFDGDAITALKLKMRASKIT